MARSSSLDPLIAADSESDDGHDVTTSSSPATGARSLLQTFMQTHSAPDSSSSARARADGATRYSYKPMTEARWHAADVTLGRMLEGVNNVSAVTDVQVFSIHQAVAIIN